MVGSIKTLGLASIMIAIIALVSSFNDSVALNKRSELKEFIHQAGDFDWDIHDLSIKPSDVDMVGALVVPHHLLATPIILETMSTVSKILTKKQKMVRQIVLLSPNHFEQGIAKSIASDCDWDTNYGRLSSDRDFIKQLTMFNLTMIDCSLLEREHGVFGLVPFIKYFFPESRITPIMLRESFEAKEAKILANFLAEHLSEESLIVVSADFSHYLPKAVADLHDRTAVTALHNLDIQTVGQLDVDTRPSLQVLLGWLRSKNFLTFNLVKQANSVDFLPDKKALETTSYVSGYYTRGTFKNKSELNVLYVSDDFLSNYLTKIYPDKNYDYPLSTIKLYLPGYDFIMTPSEIITTFPSIKTVSVNSWLEKNGITLLFENKYNTTGEKPKLNSQSRTMTVKFIDDHNVWYISKKNELDRLFLGKPAINQALHITIDRQEKTMEIELKEILLPIIN